MSIISKTRDLLNKYKSTASSVLNYIPPVQAYNAVKTIATPQYRQQVQQFPQTVKNAYQASPFVNEQASKQFVGNLQNKVYGAIDRIPNKVPQIPTIPTSIPSYVGSKISTPLLKGGLNMLASQFVGERGKTAKPLALLSPREQADFAKESALGIAGGAPGAMVAGSLETRLNAQMFKKNLPEIRNLQTMLNKGEISLQQEGVIDKAIEKYSPVLNKTMKKLLNNPTERVEYLKSLLAAAEDQALNPNTTVGLSTKAIKRNAQAGLYDVPVYRSGRPIEKAFGNDDTLGKVAFFGDRPQIAKMYGSNVQEARVTIKKPFVISEKATSLGGRGEDQVKIVREMGGVQKFREYLKREGYDGIVIEKDYGREILPFDKSQLKNAPSKQNLATGELQPKELGGLVKDATYGKNVAQQPLSDSMTQIKDVITTKAEQLGRKLPQSEGLATKVPQTQILQPKTPSIGGAAGGIPSSGNIITDPVQKVISLLSEAKPMNEQQLALYSAERSRRTAKIANIGKNVKGEGGYFAQLSALKGELPKVQFERIRNGLTQPDIDSLFNKVEGANITPFEKISAKSGLAKLLGAEGGQIPVESEMKLLSEIFPADFINAIQAKRPFMQRLWSGVQGVLNLPRSIMATLDLSAPLRQGIFMVGRPKQFGPAFGQMFKYAGSEKAYLGLMDNIKARPNYLKMREAKLALTDMSPNLLAREEEFMSNLAEKIPGFGTLAKGSNRAYSGFLNKLRADVFDDLVSKAESQGIKVQGKMLEDLGSFVNSATGRGNLGKTMQKAAPILNGAFFSPRLMASRLNLLNPVTYVKYDPFVRKEALKSLLGFGATAGTILGLAKLGGAEVGTDPRSADFGKIKTGNTRYDILGGFQQYIKLGAQLLSGQVVSSTTGKVITLGEGYKPLTRKDILMRFFEAKTSPIASFIISMITGQTGVGEPVNVPTEIINRFIPMMIQDIYDIARDQDSIGKGLIMALPGIFGAGSQTYGKSEYVEGVNKVGQPTSQIRPVQGLAETLSEKAFGKQPLGSSSTYNIQTYIKELKAMEPTQRTAQWQQMVKTNPELAKKIKQVIEDEKKGITVKDQTLKSMGVASGDRATAIAKEFNKLKINEEKSTLWQEYVKKGIITADVAKQLKILLSK